ncbi:MAG: DUF2813 domain-containing protein [Proteobacteria bacterium]|nr:DUF2813 domain-containing protein [Pseudomonadota bacterium]
MSNPLGIPSCVKITDIRVANFRSLMDVEVSLDSLTVLIGSNNAGKTSFLDAIYAAIGAGRKLLGQDDIRVAPEEAIPPKDRNVVIDIRIRPISKDGTFAEAFPEGSFWTSLWGSGITPAETDDSYEFMAFRTILSWSIAKGDYVLERKFLKEWRPSAAWLTTPMQEKRLQSSDIEPIALHYIDAKRDLDDDLRKQGSFWRRLTDDLGLSSPDIISLENALTGINQHIVDKSEILKHLKKHLEDMQSVVATEGAGIDISPVARRLRDLSKGIDVSFSTTASQSFPLTRHGMGTRSLASLLVFRAFASWRSSQAQKEGDQIHTLLALEEPESHLHPQAQRSLFSHIKTIPGQRIVSTHSPYFAGQAQLSDLRLFLKRGGNTIVTQLDIAKLGTREDLRKLQQTVVDTRGDLLFSRAVIFFEGQTEEQALPIWAEKYWDASIHELGFSFVRVNGTDYFPFISLAHQFEIPWYVLADGEQLPLKDLNIALKKIGQVASACPNVVVFPNGNNFESQFISEGYLPEIETALNETHKCADFLGDYIKNMQGQKRKGGGLRDYKVADGRNMAALDALNGLKTCMAKPLAYAISSLPDETRRFPKQIRELFEIISKEHGLTKAKEMT